MKPLATTRALGRGAAHGAGPGWDEEPAPRSGARFGRLGTCARRHAALAGDGDSPAAVMSSVPAGCGPPRGRRADLRGANVRSDLRPRLLGRGPRGRRAADPRTAPAGRAQPQGGRRGAQAEPRGGAGRLPGPAAAHAFARPQAHALRAHAHALEGAQGPAGAFGLQEMVFACGRPGRHPGPARR